jgi:N-formylglutamate deformylase
MSPPSDGFDVSGQQGPVLAVAVHHGHDLPVAVAPHVVLDEAERLREEDPFTGAFTVVGDQRAVVSVSRFACDLNRPPERCLYRTPEDAWGLRVWDGAPPPEAEAFAAAHHRRFYEWVDAALDDGELRLVLDLHSYNHRRGGPDAEVDDDAFPMLNIGTKWIERDRWGREVDAVLAALRSCSFDARENVVFGGGWFSRHVAEVAGDRLLVLAVEVRKSFMDEWTGVADDARIAEVVAALRAAVEAVV